MEKWLREAKDLAKKEADSFIEHMREIADSIDVDDTWFIEEVIKATRYLTMSKEVHLLSELKDTVLIHYRRKIILIIILYLRQKNQTVVVLFIL